MMGHEYYDYFPQDDLGVGCFFVLAALAVYFFIQLAAVIVALKLLGF